MRHIEYPQFHSFPLTFLIKYNTHHWERSSRGRLTVHMSLSTSFEQWITPPLSQYSLQRFDLLHLTVTIYEPKCLKSTTINPLLTPPPLFRGTKLISFPSLLSPPPLSLLLFFTNKTNGIYDKINDVLINHIYKTSRGLFCYGLFTNWKFGFVFDPQLHNLQPSRTWAFPPCILVLYGELIPSSLLK